MQARPATSCPDSSVNGVGESLWTDLLETRPSSHVPRSKKFQEGCAKFAD